MASFCTAPNSNICISKFPYYLFCIFSVRFSDSGKFEISRKFHNCWSEMSRVLYLLSPNHQDEIGAFPHMQRSRRNSVSTMLPLRASTIHCPATIMGIFPSVCCGLPLTSSAVACAASPESKLHRQLNPRSRQCPGIRPYRGGASP